MLLRCPQCDSIIHLDEPRDPSSKISCWMCSSDIEHDSKGVPVLLRQYLRAGGKLLGFSVDPNFSDVLDALIVADLRTAPLTLLERCMGKSEARAFVAAQRRAIGAGDEPVAGL